MKLNVLEVLKYYLSVILTVNGDDYSLFIISSIYFDLRSTGVFTIIRNRNTEYFQTTYDLDVSFTC